MVAMLDLMPRLLRQVSGGFRGAGPSTAKMSRDRLRSCIEMCQNVERATASKSLLVSFVNMR